MDDKDVSHVTAQASVELCWLTCVSSELNGGELTRSGGVDALGRLLQRCLDVLPRDAAPTLPATVISTHCLRTFAGMASFADARQQLAERCMSPLSYLHRAHGPAQHVLLHGNLYAEASELFPLSSNCHLFFFDSMYAIQSGTVLII